MCLWRVVPDVFLEGCSRCVCERCSRCACGGLFLTSFLRVVPDVFVDGVSDELLPGERDVGEQSDILNV